MMANKRLGNEWVIHTINVSITKIKMAKYFSDDVAWTLKV